MNNELDKTIPRLITLFGATEQEAQFLSKMMKNENVADTIQDLRDLLTKERAGWLRSEIEKLEGMKKPERYYDDVPPSEAEWNSGYDYGNNQALNTIITRYKEELLELEKGV